MLWFTSDLHLGHANIIDFCGRPFASVDEMNEGLIDRWNAHVSPKDTVYILGDLCMGKKDTTLPLLERLAGRKRLVAGNHDACWAGGRKDWRDWVLRYAEHGVTTIELVPPELSVPLVVGDMDVHVSHFPRYGDSGGKDERFSAWRPTWWDGWLLHGHTHVVDPLDADFRQINVGVDAWNYAPVSEDELWSLMREAERA